MRTPDFSLAAFKGVPVSIRPWDQQLRQPLLIAQPLDIVSMAPEDGFPAPAHPPSIPSASTRANPDAA